MKNISAHKVLIMLLYASRLMLTHLQFAGVLERGAVMRLTV
jgi:hypothetical protein